MRINTNINAMTALNQSTKNTALAGNSMEKLSSGLRINKAGDDAAGMAISEKMRSQIRGLDQAAKNTQDGVSMVQTAEGATEEIGNIVQRMRELTVQSSNETNVQTDREKIAEELTQLYKEIDRIAESTKFNGQQLVNGGGFGVADSAGKAENIKLTGDFTGINKLEISYASGKLTAKLTDTAGTGVFAEQTIDVVTTTNGKVSFDKLGVSFDVDGADGSDLAADLGTAIKLDITAGTGDKQISIQAGADSSSDTNQKINISIGSMKTTDLGIGQADIDAIKDGTTDTADSAALLTKLDTALNIINTSRANLGATQNRLETAQSNLTTSSENLTAAESRIRDVDVAKEMMNLSKLNLLAQASQAMMSQAKSQPEGVMQLLR